MKLFLKNRLPLLFNILKYIYRITPYYKNMLNNAESLQKAYALSVEKKELEILHYVFNNETIVQNGPFKNLQYIQRASGSALLPKIMGSYEEPIQEWVYEIINSQNYKNILDIGCAEGYYACGFAMTMPNTKIIAYDIDSNARENALELKTLNKLSNLEIKSECTHYELNSKSEKGTLIFCDIEGYEKILLDPTLVPNLKKVDLLIETHDCFVPNITDELITRFYESHTIELVVDYPFRLKNYSTPLPYTFEQFREIIDEKRSKYMKFMYMKSINKDYHIHV